MNQMELRLHIVNSIDDSDQLHRIEFGRFAIDKENWRRKMTKSGEQCDDAFISQTTNVLKRDIHVISVFENDWSGIKEAECPEDEKQPPIFVLHYPDTRFVAGHYQSIRPLLNDVNDM